MFVSCLILTWIALRDLRDHLITNSSLVALSCSLLISTRGKTNLALGTIIFIFLILLAMVVDLGGGDIKLITALALFAEIHRPFIELATLSTALMTFQIIVIWIKNGKVSARIALAPSICIPMIYSMVLQ